MINKLNLRQKFKAIRRSITDQETKDINIFKKIIALQEFMSASSILIYVSIPFEVDTRKIIEYCFANNKTIYVPLLKKLKVGEIKSFNDLRKVSTNYYEPINESSDYQIDLAIVPGLAFSKDGFRLGQGGGWYDKFLKGHKEIYKIGLCYSEQIVEDFKAEEHDVKMDLVIKN